MQPSTHLALGLPFPGDVGDTLPNRRGKLFDGDIGGVKGGDDLTVTTTHGRSEVVSTKEIFEKLGDIVWAFAYHLSFVSLIYPIIL